MKKLTCEMCGSQNLIKEGGVFVCQACGTQYSVEEAKKMMIEGTVEVQGTVKVDNSDNIEKFYQLARRARENCDYEEAEKYYSLVVEGRPNDWEAAFYKLYVSCISGTIKGKPLLDKIFKFAGSLETIYKLVSECETDKPKSVIYSEILDKSEVFIKTKLLDFDLWACSPGYMETRRGIIAAKNEWNSYILIEIGKCNEKYLLPLYSEFSISKEEMLEKFVIAKYEAAVKCGGPYKEKAISCIKKHKPDYTEKADGCYVATCVYGSYDCPQVWTLRRYRDDTLGSTWYGRAFIRTYYAISPTLVRWFGHTKWFKKMWKGKLDRMVKKLQDKGVENTPYEDKDWRK